MTREAEIQRQNLPSKQIKGFLIYYKDVRGITNRQLAEKLRYEENYLTRVRNGDVIGGEKLLHALESFYLLDNLQQVSQIEREIEELKRQKAVLQEQTIEKFYAERALQHSPRGHADKNPPAARVELNAAAGQKPTAEKPVNYAAEIVEIVAQGARPRPAKPKLKT